MDPRIVQWVGGVLAAFAIVAAALAIDQAELREHDERRREEVASTIASMGARLEGALSERIHLVRGLEALARIKPGISQREFEDFARDMNRGDPAIRALELAQNGVVSHIHPLEANRAALGHALLTDPRVAESARRAIESGRILVTGPYRLLQGDEGLVARLPVFLEPRDHGRFWGFAIVVLDFRAIVRAAALDEPAGVKVALRGRDGLGPAGDVFLGDPSLFNASAQAVKADVRFAGSHWQLAAVPTGGWISDWPGRPWLALGTIALLSLVPIAIGVGRHTAALAEAGRRSRLAERLLGSLGEGVYGVDATGRCTFINPAALAMLGWTREAIVGRPVDGLLHDPGTLASAWHRREHECRLRRRDGSTFDARLSYAPFEDGLGGVVAFNDLGGPRRAAERLRLAASVFAHAQQGIMITDAKGDIVDVNPAFTEITGYHRDEVLGRNPRILSSGRQSPEFYAELKRTLSETGAWRGEMWNRHKSGEVYPELLCIAAVPGEDGAPSHFVGVFSDISRQKQHEAELARIAHYDPLTELPNRVLMTDRLAQGLESARGSRTRVALGMLDLDRFKEINDRLGHDVGDHVLVEVARRLRGAVRPTDTVARFGGDEFVLLVAPVPNLTAFESQAHRVIEALSAPVIVDGHPVEVSASLGFTLFPDDSADPETLMRHADQAMYLAKQRGGGGWRLFDPEQDRQARWQRETLDHVARAIREGELRLHYQPKVDMRAGQAVGFEALVRWQHPQQGLVGPAAFLPVLAGTELEPALGRWVFGEALRQLGAWRSAGLHTSLGINVSATHLLHPGFLAELDGFLAAHPGIEPQSLELEVLETAAFDDLESATAVLQGCRDRGVSVAIDDFGTGYSSLAYLRHLPARTLKIDQLFIRDMLQEPADAAMVEGIIRFARAFNRAIVAEGVESTALCRALLEMGCPVVQGYAIAAPMPGDAVPEWVRTFRAPPEWSTPLMRLTA